MKVYKFWHSANGYKNIDISNSILLEAVVEGFYNDGQRYNKDFGSFHWIEQDDTPICDFPMINGCIPVVSERALTIIQPFIEEDGVEILPIKVEVEPFYILHLLKVYDVLNTRKSDIQYFKSGRVKNVGKYVFLPAVTNAPLLFQISTLQTFIFAKEELVQTISQSQLTGANFEECPISRCLFF